MKTTSNQRNLYLLALALLVIAVGLAVAWTLWGGGGSAPMPMETIHPQPSASIAPDADAADASASLQDQAQNQSTIVYYQDNYGYLVPVMCNIRQQDGIAKATLKMMVKSPENDMNAARLGLRTVLPEDMQFDLDIANGLARIDLSEEALQLEDAAAESNMIAAIVQTLTEFDSVQKVEFLVDGQKMEKLPHGTDLSQVFERGSINLEAAAMGSNLQAVKLYFPSASGNAVVPVTRMVYANADVNTAVLELAKGPIAESPLESALPPGCGLINVQMEGATAKVNFTREFADLVENTDGGRLALRALVLTCTQFEGVDRVEILVEGEAYDPGEGTLNVPTFANVASEIESAYIQTQSRMIFDFD